ncbi:general substrate transporter [Stylosanthes scabra]|uniref:General substrate transporter n=1 Tax=Stylosanthes scabra TaxID=79078 RepID=A0ABU6VK13_9FABA|nr:general substrate transporter [Stylosanthes scabra]
MLGTPHINRCTSRFGRLHPFITAGTLVVAFAGFLISFSADIGHLLGGDVEATEKEHKIRSRTIGIFVLGFWIIDIANNMLQGLCHALLADLAAGSQHTHSTCSSWQLEMSSAPSPDPPVSSTKSYHLKQRKHVATSAQT